MGILDSIMSMIGGNTGGSSSPIGGVLGGLLGGGQGSAGGQPGGGGLAGGLGGLVSQLQSAGLGNIVQSWIGTGANQPISPEQLGGALGQDQVQSMAQQSGMQPNDLLSQLAQHLPGAVDRMTPNGTLPEEGSVSV